MEARAVSGDLIGALRIYKALWELLDEEYGMEPSPETRELVARIKLGEFERPQAPKAAALPAAGAPALANDRPLPPAAGPAQSGAPRIALLLSPFEMNGVGPDKAHLVTGFRHHLAASLVRFREWSVVDNGSGTISLPADASETVQYGIDADRLPGRPDHQHGADLARQFAGHFVWSENFELNLEGWFEAQQRIIRRAWPPR